jgi:hypothetical protein
MRYAAIRPQPHVAVLIATLSTSRAATDWFEMVRKGGLADA